jgi:hypothetical protein
MKSGRRVTRALARLAEAGFKDALHAGTPLRGPNSSGTGSACLSDALLGR